MSKKFTNVIDRGRTVANKYNIVNNSDGTAIITDIPNNINVAGTPLDKNLFNPMQEGLNFTVGTVHAVENSTDVYELDIEGLKGTNNFNGLELFDGLTFNIKITEANTTNVVMLRISGDKYNLTKEDGETVINLTVGELQKNRYYKVIFDGVRFVIPLEMVEYNQFLGTNFGGLLGTVGTKKVGVAYYDVANKQMVVPKIENDLTYYESTKFIPISDYQTANKLENLYEKRAGFTRVGQTLIQWGYIENPSTNATLSYPVPFKDGTLPIVTIANWVNTELIVLTTQNNRFCSFRSSKAISLNWIAVGIA